MSGARIKYQDGSCFVHDVERKRMTVVKRNDGTFYLRDDCDPQR